MDFSGWLAGWLAGPWCVLVGQTAPTDGPDRRCLWICSFSQTFLCAPQPQYFDPSALSPQSAMVRRIRSANKVRLDFELTPGHLF